MPTSILCNSFPTVITIKYFRLDFGSYEGDNMPIFNLDTVEIKESAILLNQDADKVRGVISELEKIERSLNKMSAPRLNMHKKLLEEAILHLHQTASIVIYTSEELNRFAEDAEKVNS